MNKISMDKKYRTRSGIDVRVLCTDSANLPYPVIVEFSTGEIVRYSDEGVTDVYKTTAAELIEVLPYEDFKIDDPVMVSNIAKFWESAHFAGVNSEGEPLTYMNGKTSWSAGGCTQVWEYCRKPAAEEIAK